MLDLYAELRRLVEALDVAGIAYAVTGGLAVSIYTTPRATEDIDLLVARGDLERVITALRPLGFRRAGRPMSVAAGRLEIQRLTKVGGADILPLDLLAPVDPALTSVLEQRTRVSMEGQDVWIIGIAGLRLLKRLRGSARDQADLEALGPETP